MDGRALSRGPARRGSGKGPRTAGGRIVEVDVEALGARGDGLSVFESSPVYVPRSLPGERLAVRLERSRGDGWVGEPVELLRASPDRIEPPCPQFGTCGGCSLQHWADAPYDAWKRTLIARALQRRGVEAPTMKPTAATPRGGRRRADLSARKLASGVVVGFHERESARIVDVDPCLVLDPSLVAMTKALRTALADVLAGGETLEAVANLTDAGIDLLLVPADRGRNLSKTGRDGLVAFAQQADLARLSWGRRGDCETVLRRRPAILRFGPAEIEPPPGGFLQASRHGERALQAAVRDWVGNAKRVVDLYAGVGGLTLPLLPDKRLTLVEDDEAATTALKTALDRSALTPMAEVVRRDLQIDPLAGDELARTDAVVFDPPRAGAQAQAAALAESRVQTVIAVSCDPTTFARDARILVDGGYALEELRPVDQFLWSSHMELAALFRRPKR